MAVKGKHGVALISAENITYMPPLSFYHNNLAALGQQQSLRRSAQLKAGAPRESPGCTISLFHPNGVRLFKVHALSGGHLMPACQAVATHFREFQSFLRVLEAHADYAEWV